MRRQVPESHIELTVTVKINFDPVLYEGLVDNPNDVNQAAAFEQSQIDTRQTDIIDYIDYDDSYNEIKATFKGVTDAS